MTTEKQLQVVWTAKAIGEVIGLTERQAFHLLETKQLPGHKVGNRWASEKGRLEARVLGDVEEV